MITEVRPDDPMGGYLPEDQIAEKRKVSKRTLRAERQRGEGPPYVKDGKRIYSPLDGFRDWLKACVCHPVRAGHTSKRQVSA